MTKERKAAESQWNRREFVASLATSAVAAASAGVLLPACASCKHKAPRSVSRKKVAIIATVVRKYSHAQHFIDRFIEGYGWQGQHHRPAMELASLYVDQFPKDDLARERSSRHGVRIYPTIEEALTLGGSNLAVDGVLIIGEHGNYPKSEKGQTLYPRYEFFKAVTNVFQRSGRAVPVFNDKHLSTRWSECAEMVADSKRLGFPFMAGSSLPVTWRIPSIDMPFDTPLQESLCICYGGVDHYDIHGLETAQCMSERRKGGEVGVKSIHAVKGQEVWAMLEEREATRRLMFAALARSHTCPGPPGYTYAIPDMAWCRKTATNPTAYFIEHLDGFKTTLLLFNGLVDDFTYAGLVKGTGEIVSCQMYLPMPPRYTTLANFFSPLVNHIEQMVLDGAVPYPVERTLLTSGMTLFAVESLYQGQVKLNTPELQVNYQPLPKSAFWRA